MAKVASPPFKWDSCQCQDPTQLQRSLNLVCSSPEAIKDETFYLLGWRLSALHFVTGLIVRRSLVAVLLIC